MATMVHGPLVIDPGPPARPSRARGARGRRRADAASSDRVPGLDRRRPHLARGRHPDPRLGSRRAQAWPIRPRRAIPVDDILLAAQALRRRGPPVHRGPLRP
ncbi:MAG: hypothetical protein MZU84_09540 [Sphingobacterium sp.]|nr:hypothetical protein [Sphingobacterium sp.]